MNLLVIRDQNTANPLPVWQNGKERGRLRQYVWEENTQKEEFRYFLQNLVHQGPVLCDFTTLNPDRLEEVLRYASRHSLLVYFLLDYSRDRQLLRVLSRLELHSPCFIFCGRKMEYQQILDAIRTLDPSGFHGCYWLEPEVGPTPLRRRDSRHPSNLI